MPVPVLCECDDRHENQYESSRFRVVGTAASDAAIIDNMELPTRIAGPPHAAD